jgi:hypothetical protein
MANTFNNLMAKCYNISKIGYGYFSHYFGVSQRFLKKPHNALVNLFTETAWNTIGPGLRTNHLGRLLNGIENALAGLEVRLNNYGIMTSDNPGYIDEATQPAEQPILRPKTLYDYLNVGWHMHYVFFLAELSVGQYAISLLPMLTSYAGVATTNIIAQAANALATYPRAANTAAVGGIIQGNDECVHQQNINFHYPVLSSVVGWGNAMMCCGLIYLLEASSQNIGYSSLILTAPAMVAASSLIMCRIEQEFFKLANRIFGNSLAQEQAINAVEAVNQPAAIQQQANALEAVNQPAAIQQQANALEAVNQPATIQQQANALEAVNQPATIQQQTSALEAVNQPATIQPKLTKTAQSIVRTNSAQEQEDIVGPLATPAETELLKFQQLRVDTRPTTPLPSAETPSSAPTRSRPPSRGSCCSCQNPGSKTPSGSKTLSSTNNNSLVPLTSPVSDRTLSPTPITERTGNQNISEERSSSSSNQTTTYSQRQSLDSTPLVVNGRSNSAYHLWQDRPIMNQIKKSTTYHPNLNRQPSFKNRDYDDSDSEQCFDIPNQSSNHLLTDITPRNRDNINEHKRSYSTSSESEVSSTSMLQNNQESTDREVLKGSSFVAKVSPPQQLTQRNVGKRNSFSSSQSLQ